MMSYLWILLLGSLLATSAKAQEADGHPPNDDEIPHTTPTKGAEPDAAGDDNTEEKTNHTDEEVKPAVKPTEPEATEEQATPTAGDPEERVIPAVTFAASPPVVEAEPEGPTAEVEGSETPAAGGEKQPTPAADDKEETTAAPVEEEGLSPTVVDEEPGTPTPGDTEEATTQEPIVVPEVNDPEVVVPTADVEKPAPTPAEREPEDKGTVGPNSAVENEQPTDPAVEEEQTVREGVPGVRRIIPLPTVEAVVPDSEVNPGFNLEDALEGGPKEDTNGENTFVAVAAEDANKPQAQEGSSNSLTGILCTVGVALVGAVTGYFTYQKKKLCFKNRQEADPEAARKADAAEANSDPQVLSNLLKSS